MKKVCCPQKRLAIVAAAFVSLFSQTLFAADTAASGDPDREKAAQLVAKMSPEERVAQLMMDAPAIPRLGVSKHHWWNESLHGVSRSGLATVFPQSIGLAATFDEDLLRRAGDIASTEARAKYNLYKALGEHGMYQGLTLWSPNVNMFRDPRWGRGQETYGEDPFLTSRLGCAFVKGLQGDDPRWLKAAACAKHFAVHSGPERERHGFNAKVSKRDLAEYYLPAFEALVRDARVESFMTTYSAFNGTPCTVDKWLLTDLLRGEWGFNGHVVSDVGAVEDVFYNHKFLPDKVGVCKAAIDAGLDLCSSKMYDCLYGALKEGKVKSEDFERPLVNLFATRYRLGEFEPAGSLPWDGLGEKDVATEASRAVSLEAAQKSLVLIKNDGLLPLSRKRHPYIGMVGPRTMDKAVLYGNYHGYSASPSTCAAGMVAEAGPAWRVTTQEPDLADVIVACIGLTGLEEGEEGYGSDRKEYSIAKPQIDLLSRWKRRGKSVVAVVFCGSPVNLSEIEPLCNAIVLAWYPGETGGRAIARALLGKANFSGRLPVTFPQSYESIPDFRDYSLSGRTYLYAKNRPAYPFGYGLSYTRFTYSKPHAEATPDGGAVVRATVANTGSVAGDEVVQLYVRSPEGSGDRRVHHLEGFKRVSLAPGAEQTVEFVLKPRSLVVFGEDGAAKRASGRYAFFVGGGQPSFAATVEAGLELK